MSPTPLPRARWPALLGVAALAGCTHTVKVEPIKVEPIDITLHIYLEADQKLDEFFSDKDNSPAPAATSGTAEGAKP